MKKLLEPLIIILLTFFIISLSFIPVIKNTISAPPNTVYTMVHNYVLDYYIYLYHIAQGQQGNIATYKMHTSEPHLPTLTRLPYSLGGLLTAPLNLPPFIVYHLLRLVFALLFAFSVYYFISFYAKTPFQRIFLFFLSYASAGFVKMTPDGLTPLITHLTQLDVIRRSAFIPNYTLINSLFLLALTAVFKKKILPAVICLLFQSLLSPVHSAVFMGAMLLLTIIRYVPIKTFLILLLSVVPPVLYVNFIYSQGPFAVMKAWEMKQYEDVTFYLKDYLLNIGPIVFLAPIGALVALKKRGIKNISIILILIITYSFLFSPYLNHFFGLSNFRFHNLPTSVFLGILAFYAISLIKKSIIHKLIFIVLIIISSFSYYASYKQIAIEGSYAPFNYYLPNDLYDSFLWIKNNTKKDDVVLARFITGNMLPSFAVRRVFIGHQVSTINFAAKQVLVEKFYTNQMTPPEAQKFLKDNGITTVFVGLEESGFNQKTYPFLKQIYQNPSVTIYKLPIVSN